MLQVRKAKVKIQAVDSQGQPLPNATVSLAQFPVWQCNKPTHPKQQSLPRLVYFKIHVHSFRKRNEMVRQRENPRPTRLQRS